MQVWKVRVRRVHVRLMRVGCVAVRCVHVWRVSVDWLWLWLWRRTVHVWSVAVRIVTVGGWHRCSRWRTLDRLQSVAVVGEVDGGAYGKFTVNSSQEVRRCFFSYSPRR